MIDATVREFLDSANNRGTLLEDAFTALLVYEYELARRSLNAVLAGTIYEEDLLTFGRVIDAFETIMNYYRVGP